MSDSIIVTGGAGFIGSAVIRALLRCTGFDVVNVDKLTYAGHLITLENECENPCYHFEHVDICDQRRIDQVIQDYKPCAIMHLAAESHVDRSIDGAADFINTNIVGTYILLESALKFWRGLAAEESGSFRFQHISTDEVFGSLGQTGYFTEETSYKPNSPYSASKACSDHLVRAWKETYGLPVLLTNCSNNYGPYQFPEKLVPVVISKALAGESIPVYGDGSNVRDWLYVDDHAEALVTVLKTGIPGETYNVGGMAEVRNIDLVRTLCELLDKIHPRPDGQKYAEQIRFVTDRPGHDQRYAIDCAKIQKELGWKPTESFESGMGKTIRWYLNNQGWVKSVSGKSFDGQRLGLGENR